MKDKILRLILSFILIISAILAVVAFQAVRNIARSSDSRDWVNHTYTVLRAIEQLKTSHYVAEAGAQAYVVTNAAHDLEQCNEAIVLISEQTAIIKALTRNDPEQSKQVGDIEVRSLELVDGLQQILTARQSGDVSKARALIQTHFGSIKSAELNQKIDSLHQAQLELLTERDKASYLQDQDMRWTVWNGIGLYVLLMIGVIWLTWSDLKARARATERLKAAHDSLEVRVQERTNELERANRELILENLERQWTNQSLEHQLHYNHNIVDAVSDLVIVLTKTGQITRVNPAVLRVTGGETSDLIKQSFTKVVKLNNAPDESKNHDRHPVIIAMKEGRDLRDQPAFVVDAEGNRFQTKMSLFPLRDQNKIIGGIITLNLVPQT